MRMSRELLMHAMRAALSQGPPFEIVAIDANRPVPLTGGLTLDIATMAPAERLAVREPWARGAALVVREDEWRRVVVAGEGDCAVLVSRDGEEIERSDVRSSDADACSLLWTLLEVTPSLDESYACLLLRASIDGITDVEEAVGEWLYGHWPRLARRLDIPRPPVRLHPSAVFAAAHALGIPAACPRPGSDPSVAASELLRFIPPRWVLADEIRSAGFAHLAEQVMSAELGTL